MDGLLFLIVAGGMIYFIYKILIKPFLQGYNEKDKKINIELALDEEKENRIAQTTQVSAKLSPELYKRLNGYCDFKGLSKTYVINEAVAKYLDEIEAINPHIK